MITPDFVLRMVGMVLGIGLAALGGVLAWLATRQDQEEGCLPYVLVIAGLLMAGAAYPPELAPW
jgi:hypothetical protein